jgi:hypothetical protein
MTYLTHHPHRRDEWREFNQFPHGAVKYWREAGSYWHERYGEASLLIFKVSDDYKTLTLIPEEDWPTP